MRRPGALAAAVAAAASLTLIAPAADAAQAGHHRVVGTASCDDGGRARIVATLDAAGTGRAKVTLSGLTAKRWHGSVEVATAADPTGDGSSDDAGDAAGDDSGSSPFGDDKAYVAKHGVITASATKPGADVLGASALFFTSRFKMCTTMVSYLRHRYVMAGSGGAIVVRVGKTRKPSVVGLVGGERNHRYRIAFTMRTDAGVQHRTLVATLGAVGAKRFAVHGIRSVSSFSAASMTVTDLSVRGARHTYELSR